MFWTHKLALPPDSTPFFPLIHLSSLWPVFDFLSAAAITPPLTAVPSLVVSHLSASLKDPSFFSKSPLIHPHVDPPLSALPPPAGPLSLVRGPAVRPSPVSAAAVISSGPSGGLLLTSQA